MEGGQGGRWGGHQRAVWEQQFPFLGSLSNLSTGLIWLVTRVGGWGEAWGGGPWRAGKGGDGGGAPESSVGTFFFLRGGGGSLKNLTTGLIWLVTRVGGWGEAWGGGPWSGGGTRESVGGSLLNLNNWSDLAGTRVGGWGEAWGGGPWRAGKGGDGGGGAWFPLLGSLKNLSTGLIWLGMGGGVGRWPMEGGQGGRWGGAPESSVGATKGALIPLF